MGAATSALFTAVHSLTGILYRPLNGQSRGTINVRILKHDERIVASELKDQPSITSPLGNKSLANADGTR